MSVMVSGCGGDRRPFTAEESELINDIESGVVMRVLEVDDPAQEAFLRTIATEIPASAVGSDDFQTLTRRMVATVQAPQYDGVGLAAPQVGIPRRMVVVQRFDKEGNPFEAYVNPEITRYGEQTALGREGCLSIPERSGIVARSTEIEIAYLEPDGFTRRSEKVSGFTAVIFQHEIDHLDGILYTDRMTTTGAQ